MDGGNGPPDNAPLNNGSNANSNANNNNNNQNNKNPLRPSSRPRSDRFAGGSSSKRRRGRPAWMRSPTDSPLRDGNRDRLVGLLTER